MIQYETESIRTPISIKELTHYQKSSHKEHARFRKPHWRQENERDRMRKKKPNRAQAACRHM